MRRIFEWLRARLRERSERDLEKAASAESRAVTVVHRGDGSDAGVR
ncbi:MAG TPA: hypothetical protein VF101_01935 [Gaiellaceae bacterium]